MKILIISYEFPPQAGGIATYSQAIAKYLSLSGNEISVLAHTENQNIQEVIEFDRAQNYKILRFKNTKYKINKIIVRISQSLKFLKSENFDLVIFPYSHAAIIGKWIHKHLQIPIVMTCHGAELIQDNKLMSFFVKKLFNHADMVIANSDYTAKLLKESRINGDKIKTIYLGADDEIFDYTKYDFKALKKQYRLEHRKILSTIGSLRPIKGHAVVIHALKIIKQKYPNILYLIIGSGYLESCLKELTKSLDLEDNVRFIGNVFGQNLAEFYALSDIVILNSGEDEKGRRESFGLVLIEANLMGKPVIGTQGSGIDSAIENGKNGILVPINSPEETARAVISIYNNPAFMARLSENGYRRAKKYFTWQYVAKKTETELKALLAHYHQS